MIRWCSYCQRYQGEVEPLEDYAITHGICPACRRQLKERRLDDEFLARVRALGVRMMTTVYDGETGDLGDFLDAGRDIGMRPVDLAMGVLQPSLYRVGELWARGDITVAEEHRFSHYAQRLLDDIATTIPNALTNAPRPAVLLARMQGNEHGLGLQIVAIHLASEGISCTLLPDSVNRKQLQVAVREYQPRILGLSVSMIDQIEDIKALKAALYEEAGAELPNMVIGGRPLRNGYRLDEEESIEVLAQSGDLIARCQALDAGNGTP